MTTLRLLLSGKTAMKGLLNAITIGLTVLLSGCAGVFLVGAGVGAGAFSYIAGNLTRVYEAEYQQSIKAGTNVMKQHNFKNKEESADGLKTIIEGYRNFDTPVTIEVVYVDPGWTQIGVRTGYLGSDDLEISEQVHADIVKELKRLNPPALQTTSQMEKVQKPHNLQATSQKKKLKKPHNLQATSQKKKFKSTESKPRIYRTQYDTLPPPTETISASTDGITEDIQSINDWQEKQAPDHTESNNKTFIYYPNSSLTIHSGSYGALDDLISYLDKNPSARADIHAYTDSSANVARNLDLSRKRVFEIRNYLILNGISEHRIMAQGLAANNFLESNGTERLGSLNHPVEITIR